MKYASYAFGAIVSIDEIDSDYSFVTIAENINNIYTYIRLVVSNKTLIMSCKYKEISLDDLKIGNVVVAFHSNAMTMSIPPQTTAYIIKVKY